MKLSDREILQALVNEIEAIYAKEQSNTSKVFYIMKEISKVKKDMKANENWNFNSAKELIKNNPQFKK